MFAHAFRFDQFNARMRNTFSAPRKPRHRVLRVALGLVGVAVLAVLVMFGLFVGAAMIATGLLFKVWKQRGKPLANQRDSRVLDGEFRVVDSVSLPR
jgi:energy-converting hydrogenase Eha subunit G